VDQERYYFNSALIPTGGWLIVLREAEANVLGPIKTNLIRTTSVAFLGLLLDAGRVPVLTPPAGTPEGVAINVDADRAAAATAAALGADELLLLSNVRGLLRDPADPGSIGDMGVPEWTVLLYEFKADLNAYLSQLGPEAPVRSLEEIIEFNERESARQMPWFGQEILLLAQEKGPLTEKPYLEALATARSLAREQGIDEIMDRYQLDALVAPTGGPAWVTDLVNGDHFAGSSSEPAAIAGYPSICVPGGFVHGLPVGLSFFGRAWSEPKLLRISYAFEQATRHRRAPEFLTELDPAT